MALSSSYASSASAAQPFECSGLGDILRPVSSRLAGMGPQGRHGAVRRRSGPVTTDSAMGADEPSDDAIAQPARRHGLDPLTPSAATTQYLDQAMEHIAGSYLTAEPAELTEEVRLHIAFVEGL